jgi:hypothetical protein
MKKLLTCMIVLVFLLSYSYASAGLLGLNSAGMYPDITVDSAGTIAFTASGGGGGTLVYTATDLIITYSSAAGDFDLMGDTTFTLTMQLDNTGAIVTGNMTEIVTGISEDLANAPGGPVSYATGTTLLSGNVVAYGFDNGHTNGFARYDFLIKDVAGALVTDDIWPDTVTESWGTGIIGVSDQNPWPSATWWNDSDFTLGKAKSDKFPIPEPASTGLLIFLGLSLMGLSGFGIKKRG